MRAVWYERTGAAPDVLAFGDMPTPVAGPGEVRVRLEASGVNPADVGRRAGSYRALEFPRVIPNSDGAGIVYQIGDGVMRLHVGQRVWLFNGQRNGRALLVAGFGAPSPHPKIPFPAPGSGANSGRICSRNSDFRANVIDARARLMRILQRYSDSIKYRRPITITGLT